MTDGHSLHPSILREYDIRGIVGDTLTPADLTAIGRAFAAEVHAEGGSRVALGYDGRLSSPELAAALRDGLVASGMHVLEVGQGPSPMLYFATHELEADAGLMITGSHNPPDYNGLKMTLKGRAYFGDDIKRLGVAVAAGGFRAVQGSSEKVDVFDAYVARLLKDFRPGRDLAVAWDPGNGAAGDVLRALTAKLPGRHVLINDKIDGTFPAHHPDPTVEKNLAQLKDLVRRENCEIGIGFDGDGDRIGAVDAQGRVMWGDQMMTVLAREVLRDEPGAPILCDVKASRVFFDEIRRLGGEPVMWKAGHSHIKTKMKELHSPLAGEMSAHIFFGHRYYGYDDALYAAVRLLSIVAEGPDTLADMLDAMPKTMSTPEIRMDCPEERKFAAVEEIKKRVASARDVTVYDMDGVRVENADGWWLLRASNTQAALSIRCEADTADALERLKATVARHLTAVGIAPPAEFV